MTTKYAVDAADALADITEAGAAVSFTLSNPGVYDAVTDTYSGATTTTVAGYAVAIEADPVLYRALELISAEAKTLLFGLTTAGSLPTLNMAVTWGGVAFTVKHVKALDPDGTAILGEVTVAR